MLALALTVDFALVYVLKRLWRGFCWLGRPGQRSSNPRKTEGKPTAALPTEPETVPPSLAGVVQPQFATGSATAPPASALFPDFSTSFPVPTVETPNIFNMWPDPVPETVTTPVVT